MIAGVVEYKDHASPGGLLAQQPLEKLRNVAALKIAHIMRTN